MEIKHLYKLKSCFDQEDVIAYFWFPVLYRCSTIFNIHLWIVFNINYSPKMLHKSRQVQSELKEFVNAVY